MDIFLGSSQNWTILYILGSFLKVKVQNGGYFLGARISNIYLGCLKFFLRGEQ